MTTHRASTAARRPLSPVTKNEADRLLASRTALAQFVMTAFRDTFGADIDTVMFDAFPDGLWLTLVTPAAVRPAHNLWAMDLAEVLREASVPIHVVVRSQADFHE
ncbi:MAG: hypothetical protein IT373_25705 [Polyangiaceae bacterium]|nr:hypothetical protein [Polyangiaceae bacterium]